MIVHNQLVTTFLARGGQALGVIGQMTGGMMNIGRAAQGTNRQMGLLDQQTRAFGTTLRYAFAGTVIFGVTSMIGKLSQLQQQMGLIAAISGPAGVNLTGGALAQLQDEIAAKAVASRTPVDELNKSVINFLSTVQGTKRSEIADIVGQIGISAKLSQTPTEDLTKAVTTLNIAAGRPNNLKTINSLLREWFSLISSSPGGISAAPQIAQQLGPLSSVAQAGQLTPEQLFGFSAGALKFGATPSTALRGTQYFLQALFQGTSKTAKEELKKAGFTPERLQKQGGAKFTMDYLKYVKSLGAKPTIGGVRKFGAMTDTMLDTEAELAPNQNIPGLSPKALAFLKDTLGRIHGIRTALVLLRQLDREGTVPSLTETFKTMLNLKMGGDQLDKAIRDYQRQTPLQAAAIALDTLRTVVSRDIAPILGVPAGGLEKGAGALTGNKQARHAIEIGGAALLTAMGARSIMKRGGFGGLLGMGGQGIVTAQAAHAIASGNLTIGHTPANPIFVTVVGQIFGGRNTPGDGGLPKPPIVAAGRFGKYAKYGKFAKWGGISLGAYALTQLAIEQGLGKDTIGISDIFSKENIKQGWNWNPFDRHKGGMKFPDFNKMKFPHLFRATSGLDKVDPFGQEVLNRFSGGKLTPAQAEARLTRMGIQKNFDFLNTMGKHTQFAADGEIVLNIKIKTPEGTANKRVHVPASLYTGGKGPSARGKRKSVKADFPESIPVLRGW